MASSPAAPNAGVAGFMKKYRTFVRRHRALLSAIEQGAAGMTWFIEGENSEVYAEAASSVVGVMSTGDELAAPGAATLNSGQIRDSNRPMLLAAARELGAEVRCCAPPPVVKRRRCSREMTTAARRTRARSLRPTR